MFVLISPKTAAERLGLTPTRVRALIKSGKLIAEDVGIDRHIWAIDEAELERFAALTRPQGRPRKDKTMTLLADEITELAKQIGIDPKAAIQAFQVSADANAISFRALREWQRANQEQAGIVSDILRQREGNLSAKY